MRGRGRNADHKRLAAEHDHAIDAVSVDYAFFGAHGQIVKFVLIARAHKCKWTEALSCIEHRRPRSVGCKVLSVREPSILDFKKHVVAELGGSHDVIMEASPANEHQSNGLLELAVVRHDPNSQAGA